MNEETFVLYDSIGQLVTLEGVARKNGRNPKREDLGVIDNGALVADAINNTIVWVGSSKELPDDFSDLPNRFTAEDEVWLPELVECHTHLIYAGQRHHDYALRAEGKTYLEIANEGGGILSTVKYTREAENSELFESALHELERFQKYGIGTVEIKSGYGLDLKNEIRILKCIEALQQNVQMNLIPTFMPAHSVPPEFKGRTDDYVDTICKEWIPEIAKTKLARFLDAFIEKGIFELEHAKKLCEAAKMHGMELKLHCEQFFDLGSTSLAVDYQARSVDHLDFISNENILKLANSDTVAVLLPGASLYLGTPYPPARKLLDSGARVALSTDFNPGTCPTRNLPLMTTIACSQMKMTVAEAIAGITYNAAASLGMEDQIGSLEVGKEFRVCQLKAKSFEVLPYCFGELD